MKKLLFFFTASLFFMLMSCSPQSDFVLIEEAPVQKPETPVTPSGGLVPDIPGDDEADPAPTIEPNVTLPRAAVSGEMRSGVKCVRVDMTGITDLAGGWLTLYETGSSQCNIWITVDDVNDKGLHAINIAAGSETTAKADIVFLVDNSGSMSEEAEGVARDISNWAYELVSSGVDATFGSVGFGYHVGSQYDYPTNDYGIVGALDLTEISNFSEYLNRTTGLDRTKGYSGSRADELENYVMYAPEEYTVAGGECGMQALLFADKYFSFRPGASRVYLQLTDDANYPGGLSKWSVENLKDPSIWSSERGTIHTVFSNDTSYYTSLIRTNYTERSWDMSALTGGSLKLVSPSFTDVTLSDLPVTGALQNSYVIYFTNIDALLDGNTHKVVITISSAEGVKGILTLYVNFSSLTYI